jgi:hypothetical protein
MTGWLPVLANGISEGARFECPGAHHANRMENRHLGRSVRWIGQLRTHCMEQ